MIWFTLLIFIAVLAVLIFVHEIGHFLSARWSGVAVEEFGVGFPPRLAKFKKGKTIYSINWLPLGGFVKIKGEQGDHAEDRDSFAHKKIWQRSLIISAGVVMNVVLTMILLSVGFMIGSPQILSDDLSTHAKVSDRQIQIFSVLAETPAQQAGLEAGDVVISLDGQKFNSLTEFKNYLASKDNSAVKVTIKRGGEEINKEITPKILATGNPPVLGIELIQSGIVSYPWYEAIWVGAKSTVYLAKEIVVAFYTLIKNLVVHQEVAVELAGPVGIAVLTGEVAKMGFIYLLQFVALLSLNLAIINFLPFPALDGGRFLFLIIEKIRGKAANQKWEAIIRNIGFVLLIMLVLVVTYRDVVRWGDRIMEVVKSAVGF